MKTPLYFLPSPFFNFFFRPSLLPAICLHPNWSICCLLSLAESMIAPHLCAILLDDIMDVHMSSFRTLMHFYATSGEIYWGLTHDVVFCLYSDMISHTHTHIHTQRHTAHPGASRLTHPYKYIFIPTVMCSQQLSLLHWMKKSLVSKIFLPQSFLFKNYSLENHICRLDAIILIEMMWINKTHTRAHQTLRER